MNTRQQPNLYRQVIAITTSLLGPASERFIDRQIDNHLHKKPDDLTSADLAELVDWIKISLALLTDDTHTVEVYTGELRELTKQTTNEK